MIKIPYTDTEYLQTNPKPPGNELRANGTNAYLLYKMKKYISETTILTI